VRFKTFFLFKTEEKIPEGDENKHENMSRQKKSNFHFTSEKHFGIENNSRDTNFIRLKKLILFYTFNIIKRKKSLKYKKISNRM